MPARHKVLLRILRVDPALDRMPGDPDIFLAHRGSGSPEAILICSLMRSISVTDSVTGCSTWIPRVHFHEIEIFLFIQKGTRWFPHSHIRLLSPPGPPSPPHLFAEFIRRSLADGDSSRTFWCLLWIEQSRSPRWTTFPYRSPRI